MELRGGGCDAAGCCSDSGSALEVSGKAVLRGGLRGCTSAALKGAGREATWMSISAGVQLALSAPICCTGFEDTLEQQEDSLDRQTDR